MQQPPDPLALPDQPRRASPRHKAFQPVMVRLRQQIVRAHVLDISAHGALLHMPAPPEVGTMLMVSVPDRWEKAGTVKWRSKSRAGIAFLTPFLAEALEALFDPPRD